MGSTVSICQEDNSSKYLPIPKLVRHDPPDYEIPKSPISENKYVDDWEDYMQYIGAGYNTSLFPQFAFTPIETKFNTAPLPKILPLLLD